MINHEFQTLRELKRIFDNPAERVIVYRRWQWNWYLAGVVLVGLAFLMTDFESIRPFVNLLLAVLGGALIGVSIIYSIARKQIPLMVRYSTFHDEAVQKRLEEIKHS